MASARGVEAVPENVGYVVTVNGRGGQFWRCVDSWEEPHEGGRRIRARLRRQGAEIVETTGNCYIAFRPGEPVPERYLADLGEG